MVVLVRATNPHQRSDEKSCVSLPGVICTGEVSVKPYHGFMEQTRGGKRARTHVVHAHGNGRDQGEENTQQEERQCLASPVAAFLCTKRTSQADPVASHSWCISSRQAIFDGFLVATPLGGGPSPCETDSRLQFLVCLNLRAGGYRVARRGFRHIVCSYFRYIWVDNCSISLQ